MKHEALQPSTSHSMGDLLTVPQQSAAYQERLVDWDQVAQPGATISQIQYQYQNPGCSSSSSYQRPFYPNHWVNGRPIPTILEPGHHAFLSIPSHCERYPPRPYYPATTTLPHYAYYRTSDKTEDAIDVEQICADRSGRTLRRPPLFQVEEDGTNETVAQVHHETEVPELSLDLDSETTSSDESTEKCWKSPEEVRLGCGRVAALAKHFAQLGDAGLIKFKSSRQFASEPDMTSPPRSAEARKTRDAKSEADLAKADRTGPGAEWGAILLDIQARSEDKSKLTEAEQRQIIEQLEEFANLDNASAPLFIPGKEARLEHARKHSLPAILGSLRITPTFMKDKCWSLKDLASSTEDVKSDNESPKYYIFPTCSRVVSAPEISHEDLNLVVTSTISLGDESDTLHSSTSSGMNSVRFVQAKVSSVLDLKAKSRSQDDLCREKAEVRGDKLSKSLDRLNGTKREPAIEKKPLILRKKAKSDLDVSQRKATPRFERANWIFRQFPPLDDYCAFDSRKLAR